MQGCVFKNLPVASNLNQPLMRIRENVGVVNSGKPKK
jgi:hypothetical protein